MVFDSDISINIDYDKVNEFKVGNTNNACVGRGPLVRVDLFAMGSLLKGYSVAQVTIKS